MLHHDLLGHYPHHRYRDHTLHWSSGTEDEGSEQDCSFDDDSEIFGDYTLTPKHPPKHPPKQTQVTPKPKTFMKPCKAVCKAPTVFLPPEVLDIVYSYVDQTTLCRSLRLVCRSWNVMAKRHIDRKGVWTLGPQEDEDKLLADIERGYINILELIYNGDLANQHSKPASPLIGRFSPYDEWPWAWQKFVAILSGDVVDGMDEIEIQEARNRCPMHRIKKIAVRSASMWDPQRLPALLPSMQWVRDLDLDSLDNLTGIVLFPILDMCSSLESLSIKSSSDSSTPIQWTLETSEEDAMTTLVEPLPANASISFQTYRLLYFSATSVDIQHSAICSLLDSCPNLRSCKVLQSQLSDSEGNIIRSFDELASTTTFLYRRAALVCPRLVEFHLPPVGPWHQSNEMIYHADSMLTLQLTVELFRQSKYFSLQCCMPRIWIPSVDIRHYLGQLTHLDIDTEPLFDHVVFHRILGYTYSLLCLSAPTIRYERRDPTVAQTSIDDRMEPYRTRKINFYDVVHSRRYGGVPNFPLLTLGSAKPVSGRPSTY
ncbi:hypothetical protein BG004_005144 [Podila humilis]|nr:hypothetical protein BG004_005144 [Podila humilis]